MMRQRPGQGHGQGQIQGQGLWHAPAPDPITALTPASSPTPSFTSDRNRSLASVNVRALAFETTGTLPLHLFWYHSLPFLLGRLSEVCSYSTNFPFFAVAPLSVSLFLLVLLSLFISYYNIFSCYCYNRCPCTRSSLPILATNYVAPLPVPLLLPLPLPLHLTKFVRLLLHL